MIETLGERDMRRAECTVFPPCPPPDGIAGQLTGSPCAGFVATFDLQLAIASCRRRIRRKRPAWWESNVR